MNKEVIISCAVTGAGDSVGKNPHVPVSPKQIAEACIEAAEAGAAIAHIHVRNPETGKAGRDLDCYREVVERIRSQSVDIVLNLTCGMGGELHLDLEDPRIQTESTDLVSSYERMQHVHELRPEMCTIDCGSMNFGANVVINRSGDLEKMAAYAMEWGVKPELEVFDMGQVGQALRLVDMGLVPGNPLFQFVLGVFGGAPANVQSILAMKGMLPANAQWAAFGIAHHEMPMVAQAVLLGGHTRVGLEDNLYLEKGVLATNGMLVERARSIVENLGARTLTPQEARETLGLANENKRMAS
jgi:uncharacterized protein (DUF849 family)